MCRLYLVHLFIMVASYLNGISGQFTSPGIFSVVKPSLEPKVLIITILIQPSLIPFYSYNFAQKLKTNPQLYLKSSGTTIKLQIQTSSKNKSALFNIVGLLPLQSYLEEIENKENVQHQMKPIKLSLLICKVLDQKYPGTYTVC